MEREHFQDTLQLSVSQSLSVFIDRTAVSREDILFVSESYHCSHGGLQALPLKRRRVEGRKKK